MGTNIERRQRKISQCMCLRHAFASTIGKLAAIARRHTQDPGKEVFFGQPYTCRDVGTRTGGERNAASGRREVGMGNGPRMIDGRARGGAREASCGGGKTHPFGGARRVYGR